jgi:hypothetical protein
MYVIGLCHIDCRTNYLLEMQKQIFFNIYIVLAKVRLGEAISPGQASVSDYPPREVFAPPG